MAKKKIEDNDEYVTFAGEIGSQLLSTVEPVKYYVDTGSLALNYVCSGKFINGGIPGGKISQIYGSSSSGKSLIACNILRGAIAIDALGVYLDCENALNRDFAVSASHVDPNKIFRCNPPTLESAFLKIHNIMRAAKERWKGKKNVVFVYDSIAVSPCERELKETNLTENYSQAEFKRVVGGKEQPGERAKICSRELRKIDPCLEDTHTLCVINQLRSKVGITYGSPLVTTSGNSLNYYCSCILQAAIQKKIENNYGAIIGVNLKISNVKNRIFMPFRVAQNVKLFFKNGVDPTSALLDIFTQTGRIEEAGKTAHYKVSEPYANGKEIIFKMTKEKNSIPVDVLVQCPSLIDAKSEDEVIEYLSIFNDAIAESNNENNVEKLILDEEEE